MFLRVQIRFRTDPLVPIIGAKHDGIACRLSQQLPVHAVVGDAHRVAALVIRAADGGIALLQQDRLSVRSEVGLPGQHFRVRIFLLKVRIALCIENERTVSTEITFFRNIVRIAINPFQTGITGVDKNWCFAFVQIRF